MKVAFYTLGCKTNQFETQALERLFASRGHAVVDFKDTADAYVINTCTVTALGDKKSRAAARQAKKRNPAALLIVCGCYAQVSPEEVRTLCGADIVLGSSGKGQIVELAEQALAGSLSAPDIPPALSARPFEQLPAGGLLGRTRALLKVQDGCQNFCSYCLIPFARGPSRSMPLDDAVRECARLEQDGYREVVVTGIEISSYGLDLPQKSSLLELAPALCAAAPCTRIRLGSLEPRTITEEFARALSMHDNLCPHFHLSLQSGCDRTLRTMGRRYDTARFLLSCDILRRYFPGCAITTDLIVGFPGETEEDFLQTLDFLDRAAFAQVHVFPYSRRKGTRAYSMPGQVDRAERESRARRASGVCARTRMQYLQSRVGQTAQVLFEQPDGAGSFCGHDMQYCPVRAPGAELSGQVRAVRIVSADEQGLCGQIMEPA